MTGALLQPTTRARLFGLGSVFGKSVRDSRRTAIALGIVFSLFVVATAAQVAADFPSLLARQTFARQLSALPAVFQGMLGEPIRIDTLGGFVSWRIFNFLPVMFGIWSVVALSGTLAGELARGSLDPLAATSVARRRLAIQKVLGFLAAVTLGVVILEVVTFAAITLLGTLPGDEVSVGQIVGQGSWLLLTIIAPGALSFLVAPYVGRGGAMAAGGIALAMSFVVNAYALIVPAFATLQPLSYLALTADHRPLAGQWDWGSMGVLAGAITLMLAGGVLAFERRDLLAPSSGRLQVPPIRIWVGGVFRRGIGERLPASLLWGLGLALYALLIATSADEFVTQMAKIPQISAMVHRLFPDADIFSTAGFLQLAFFQQGIVMVSLAAAVAVGGWASDEGDRRLEVVLAAPISRREWMIRGGLAVMVSIALSTLLMASGVALGASLQGDQVALPTIGVLVLGLYGMALAGIGLAIGGLIRPSLAAPVTAILGLGFFIFDILGSVLDLPDPVRELDLNRHLGAPIIGDFDTVGLVICAVFAFGGLVVSAIGMQRRDIGR